jgi:hypothetical protein
MELMNLILQAIKSLFRKLENKIEKDIVNNRSDWEQNNENGVGYIKNRPFYSEEKQIDVLPVGNYYMEDVDGLALYSLKGVQLVEGVEYTIIFDNIVEKRLAIWEGSIDTIDLKSSEKTDLEVYNYHGDIMFASWRADGNHYHHLGLSYFGEEIKQIDEKFMPDSIELEFVNIQEAVNNAQTTADLKMDKENPVGTGSFSMNRKADTEIGDYSHAEGYYTTASGDYCHAEGYYCEANGNSHAEGYSTTASGRGSHAEGYDTTAEEGGHAEGNRTKALGYYSHAEGYSTTASGFFSHAEGTRTTASGYGSHAEGRYSIVDNAYSYRRFNDVIIEDEGYRKISSYEFDNNNHDFIVTGISVATVPYKDIFVNQLYTSGTTTYDNEGNVHVKKIIYVKNKNITNNTLICDVEEIWDSYAHIAGNGYDNIYRSNAHTLSWDGVPWYQGRPQFGGNA